jgi:hypothetical protein
VLADEHQTEQFAHHTLTVLDLRTPEADPHVDGALPVVHITTHDGLGITSKEVYSPSTFALTTAGSLDADGDQYPQVTDTSARLRVRGNVTSMALVKLAYKVKLDKKSSLLGMPKSKDWVLLANFFDRSLLRTDVALAAARRVGVPWAARMHHVNVYVDGRSQGVYQLGEGIEVEKDRVDITLDDDGDGANGGYVLEGEDNFLDTVDQFRTTRGLSAYIKDPDERSAAYIDAVRSDFQEFEDALYSPQFRDPVAGYRPHVDLQSFVDWFLVHEFVKSIDANFSRSTWMQRDLGGRLRMGPPWDFDFSSGNRYLGGISSPTGWFLLPENGFAFPPVSSMIDHPEGHYLQRMTDDPDFVRLLKERWRVVGPRLAEMPAYVRTQAAHIAPSATLNFAPRSQGGADGWIGPSMLDGADQLFRGSWEAEVDALAQWYEGRIVWLDGAIAGLEVPQG